MKFGINKFAKHKLSFSHNNSSLDDGRYCLRDFQNKNTHTLVSFPNIFSLTNRINEVHMVWYGMDNRKNTILTSVFSIRNEKECIFHIWDYIESPYGDIWNKGVVA